MVCIIETSLIMKICTMLPSPQWPTANKLSESTVYNFPNRAWRTWNTYTMACHNQNKMPNLRQPDIQTKESIVAKTKCYFFKLCLICFLSTITCHHSFSLFPGKAVKSFFTPHALIYLSSDISCFLSMAVKHFSNLVLTICDWRNEIRTTHGLTCAVPCWTSRKTRSEWK